MPDPILPLQTYISHSTGKHNKFLARLLDSIGIKTEKNEPSIKIYI